MPQAFTHVAAATDVVQLPRSARVIAGSSASRRSNPDLQIVSHRGCIYNGGLLPSTNSNRLYHSPNCQPTWT